ncbi:MAG TPA: hypothetical protein VIK13_03120 [Candidatus Limnocylindrales bacterium]
MNEAFSPSENQYGGGTHGQCFELRIGQKHPVRIFNFSMLGTIEERVLDVLSNRIRVFEETIGGLDPILGEVENDLRKVFLLADAEGKRALRDLDLQLGARVREARTVERRLADLIMDTKSYRKDEVERLLGNRGPVNSDMLRRFTLAALSELGATINRDEAVEGAYELRLYGAFENEFPHFAKEGRSRRGTFDPSVAREHEELEFFAIGHEIVDALIARSRSREYGGRTSYRLIKTDDHAPASGWFFTYLLEFEGVVGSKEVIPVFVDREGLLDEDTAAWLLERSGRLKREDWGPARTATAEDGFEAAVELANTTVITRLLARQAELESTNRERVASEREKVDRFYAYRATAAQEKLAAVRTTFERLSASPDPEVQRILPVWRKNVQNAGRGLAGVADERARRLAQLAGLDVVAAQHEALTASFVDIVPDPGAP